MLKPSQRACGTQHRRHISVVDKHRVMEVAEVAPRERQRTATHGFPNFSDNNEEACRRS